MKVRSTKIHWFQTNVIEIDIAIVLQSSIILISWLKTIRIHIVQIKYTKIMMMIFNISILNFNSNMKHINEILFSLIIIILFENLSLFLIFHNFFSNSFNLFVFIFNSQFD
jgi:hypothetical protein